MVLHKNGIALRRIGFKKQNCWKKGLVFRQVSWVQVQMENKTKKRMFAYMRLPSMYSKVLNIKMVLSTLTDKMLELMLQNIKEHKGKYYYIYLVHLNFLTMHLLQMSYLPCNNKQRKLYSFYTHICPHLKN